MADAVLELKSAFEEKTLGDEPRLLTERGFVETPSGFVGEIESASCERLAAVAAKKPCGRGFNLSMSSCNLAKNEIRTECSLSTSFHHDGSIWTFILFSAEVQRKISKNMSRRLAQRRLFAAS